MQLLPALPTGVNLDHVGLFADDLSHTARQYEALGFLLTPQSQHSRPPTPDAPISLRGTANRCAMLQQGYIELLGVVDPGLDTLGVPEALARYEGLHILAFGLRDADTEQARLKAAGFEPGRTILERRVDLPDGSDVARFIQVRPDASQLPEGRVFMLQHETPELVWQPRYLTHPNTAIALAETTVAVSNLDEAAARYERFLGCAAQAGPGYRLFTLTHGALRLVTPEYLHAVAPDARVPALPFPAACTVTVASLERAVTHLNAHAVPFQSCPGGIRIAPKNAGGMTLVFQESI
ncbi:VOC family protein [Bordetella sp. 15P40C-2]|uniref:VOC family protein n=1 Tax=Bordetella sp. 15P40C-2 TaxID=2572246 RepID=UPI0013205C3C|nr:VOC family protein [Bordetella sp. 15P40C-2]MVW71173.1 VOC family protein [Bordetella sp. 15P40C-2]